MEVVNMQINENNLPKQLKKKNTKALDFLVDSYNNLLYKIIYNILNNYGDKNLIDECLNDVFLSIWNNADMFRGKPEKFVHWICTIAKYKAIDYQRKLHKSNEVIDINLCKISSDYTPEDILIANEGKNELLKYIDELDNITKNIFLRRFFLGESIVEIANNLNVSRGVIDTRLSRGRKLLKEKLINFNNGGDNNEEYIRTV